ncbi:esterase/lipase family protein [Gemmatimonadota bacterium]
MKAIPFATLFMAGALLMAGPKWSIQQVTAQTMPQDSSVHRRPVVLVPGWAGRSRHLNALKERFLRDGWVPAEVMDLEFTDPVGSSRDHATELEEALRALTERTGVREADIVAHSMGGLALWLLLQDRRGEVPVRRVVFLGSPLQGTLTAYLAWGEGGEEMRPGSPFLRALAEGPPPQEWVEALTIRTPLDLNVVPGSGGTLPGLWDVMVCCPTHQGLMDDEGTYRIAREFLLFGTRSAQSILEEGSGISGRK